ncbi:hypothetical protein [Pseudoxanthomonas sp. CF125]|uniref:hypothetical protein n=1 Tax=Pseudoxanthomonas sp. CF125 TaxID=1855303 RepID=UPI000883C797|nr:hypothetical protein [Pseudoxanthomonas sp. CF125]SDQ61460.1 hypothetical protein SAMN05216569_1819 [Pseudoxanthomonas sp. CF125]
MQTRHVFSVPDLAAAQDALRVAREAGLTDDNLSLIARADIELDSIPDLLKDAATDFMPAALRGAGTGAAVGLVAGLVAMAFPLLGVSAAGVALLTIGGAAIGTWVSALLGSTVDDPVRRKFEQEIKAGRILVVLDAEDPQLPAAEAALLGIGAARLPYEGTTALT